jgi:hypothetical protein
MFGECSRLWSFAVEPCSEEATSFNEFLNAESVLWEFSDCENRFSMILPKLADERVAIEGA